MKGATKHGSFRLVVEKPQWVYGIVLTGIVQDKDIVLVKVGKTEWDPEGSKSRPSYLLGKSIPETYKPELLFGLRPGAFHDYQLESHEKWIRGRIGWKLAPAAAEELKLPVKTEWVICHVHVAKEVAERIEGLNRANKGSSWKNDSRCFDVLFGNKVGSISKGEPPTTLLVRDESGQQKVLCKGPDHHNIIYELKGLPIPEKAKKSEKEKKGQEGEDEGNKDRKKKEKKGKEEDEEEEFSTSFSKKTNVGDRKGK